MTTPTPSPDPASPSENEGATSRPLPMLRAMIDAVDHEVLQLLSRRNGLVAEVAAYKRSHSVGIRDVVRERELMIDRRARSVPLGLRPDVVESIYRMVLWASRDRQAALRAQVPLDIEAKTIAIIGGRGGMGQCMAGMFADLGHAVMIADLETDLTPIEAAKVADVVMISVPIDATVDAIREIGPHVREESLLMDVSSIKVGPFNAMMESTAASVLGTHPLFGPSVHTLQGQRIVFVPGRGDAWKDWCRTMFAARGLNILEATAEAHDQAMSIVQVLTHFSTEVMGRTLASLDVDLKQTLEFTSPVYLLELLMTARHFAQSPDLYASIQMSNPETERITSAFVAAANAHRNDVLSEDRDAIRAAFEAVHEMFGDFSETAMEESSYLIDRLVERA